VSLPAPLPGLVIRYAFLWKREARAGTQEARKERPAAIVIVSRKVPDGPARVVVVPVTHSPPRDLAAAVELPDAVARSLGLDDGRHWIVCDEVNRFAWPGYDLRLVPGRSGVLTYGMLPEAIYDEVLRRVIALDAARRVSVTTRD
jgi:hypothetical protein